MLHPSLDHTITPIESIAPIGGLGDASYAANSSNQGNAVKSLYPKLREAVVQLLNLPSSVPLIRAVDLGCSSGMNSINSMDFLCEVLKEKFGSDVEVQAFFADLPSNDFNTLSSLLGGHAKRDYFVAAVPGSFYHNIFPKASLHVACSFMSLHWISKIPEEVQRRENSAWNGEHVWIHDGNPKAAEAYAKLAKRDLHDFLKARSLELLPGGLLFLVLKGRSNPNPTKQYYPEEIELMSQVFASTWNDLVAEGVISRELRDSFNFPLYFRTEDEVMEAVRECPAFKLEHLELLDIPILGAQKHEIGSVMEQSRKLANSYNSLWGGYLNTHLGLEKSEVFQKRIEENAIAYVQARPERKVAYKGSILLILTHI